jgi:predicted HTH transcriptional regulator
VASIRKRRGRFEVRWRDGHGQEQIIMEYLDRNPEINNPRARELTNIDSEYRVRRILARLINAGEVEKVPGEAKSRHGVSKATGRRQRAGLSGVTEVS